MEPNPLPSTKIPAAWLGAVGGTELAAVWEAAQQLPGVDWHVATNVAEAGKAWGDDRPALCVVAACWPDEFEGADFAALLEWAPLTRIVYVAGLWGVSVGRTRGTWPLAVRVPWEQALPRIQHELRVIAGQEAGWPLSALGEDFRDHDPVFDVPAPKSTARHALIDTNDPALAELWSTEARDRGWEPVFHPHRESWSPKSRTEGSEPESRGKEWGLVLCDLDPWVASKREALRTWASAGATIIGLSHWITPQLRVELTGIPMQLAFKLGGMISAN